MSAHDYLWPARPEYMVHREAPPPSALRVWLDLRDVTARAHAAMAWTKMGAPPSFVIGWAVEPTVGPAWDGDDVDHMVTLCRMRCMDESVTVAEAREALGWAERVAS